MVLYFGFYSFNRLKFIKDIYWSRIGSLSRKCSANEKDVFVYTYFGLLIPDDLSKSRRSKNICVKA